MEMPFLKRESTEGGAGLQVWGKGRSRAGNKSLGVFSKNNI